MIVGELIRRKASYSTLATKLKSTVYSYDRSPPRLAVTQVDSGTGGTGKRCRRVAPAGGSGTQVVLEAVRERCHVVNGTQQLGGSGYREPVQLQAGGPVSGERKVC